MAEHWSHARRIAFRFACAYLLLYALPLLVARLPFGGTLIRPWTALTDALAVWTGSHVLHVPEPIAMAVTGSGDTMLQYLTVLVLLVIAVAITIVWTAVDRARTEYRDAYAWVLVTVRFALAAVMFGYGFVKIFPLQMGEPGLERLIQPLGDYSPMGLLWTFMGYSTTYLAFTGFGEALGALLLCFRRTATLGALVLVAVLANVALLNLTFDVPVKLFSLHLLGMAVFIAAADAGRLWDVLVAGREARARVERAPAWHAVNRPAILAIHAALVLWLLGSNGWRSFDRHFVLSGAARAHPLTSAAGVYDVASLSGIADSASRAWALVVLERSGILTIRQRNDSVLRFSAVENAPAQSLMLYRFGGPPGARSGPARFRYDRPDSVSLRLTGALYGDSIVATLRRRTTDFRLKSRPFRWIQEAPYNR